MPYEKVYLSKESRYEDTLQRPNIFQRDHDSPFPKPQLEEALLVPLVSQCQSLREDSKLLL